jgi:hypothetical protein
MYLLACRIMIKIKQIFSTFNYKILYLTIQKVCREKLSLSDSTDCMITTIEEEKIVFAACPNYCQCFEI